MFSRAPLWLSTGLLEYLPNVVQMLQKVPHSMSEPGMFAAKISMVMLRSTFGSSCPSLTPRFDTSDHLLVPTVKLSAVGRHTFPVAGAHIWNDLPSDVTSSTSLLTFKHIIQNALISQFLSCSNLLTVLTISHRHLLVLLAAACCLGHVKNVD